MRPGYHQEYDAHPERYRGRSILYFDTIDAAYNYAEEEEDNPLIMIHTGVYSGEYLVIESNITILGAGTYPFPFIIFTCPLY